MAQLKNGELRAAIVEVAKQQGYSPENKADSSVTRGISKDPYWDADEDRKSPPQQVVKVALYEAGMYEPTEGELDWLQKQLAQNQDTSASVESTVDEKEVTEASVTADESQEDVQGGGS